MAIRDNEMERVKTMIDCQDIDAPEQFNSPHNASVEILLPAAIIR